MSMFCFYFDLNGTVILKGWLFSKLMVIFDWCFSSRSNGFEKKRYERIADKRAAQEVAYKWSVEDM